MYRTFSIDDRSTTHALRRYIANYIYENTTKQDLDLNLKGIWIADPSTSYDLVQEQIPAVTFM